MQFGDVVEHTRGRWKGRRLYVLDANPDRTLKCVDDKGTVSHILQPTNLQVVDTPLPTNEWIRIWHRTHGNEKLVLRRAFTTRSYRKRLGMSLEQVEQFLATWKSLINPTR